MVKYVASGDAEIIIEGRREVRKTFTILID